jgi:hypothetical protein
MHTCGGLSGGARGVAAAPSLSLASLGDGGDGDASDAVAVRDWFWAAYLVTAHSPGFSARQLQRQLGLGRYETAWVMLQKLRRAMIRPDRDRIAGIGEVDETYLGGAEEGRAGCRWRDSRKSIVVAAVEVRGRGTGRIRLGTVPDVSGPSLVGFGETVVAPGARSGRTAGRATPRSSSAGMTSGRRRKERRKRPRYCSHGSTGSLLTSRRGSGALIAA